MGEIVISPGEMFMSDLLVTVIEKSTRVRDQARQLAFDIYIAQTATNWRVNHKPSRVNGSPDIFTSPSQVKCETAPRIKAVLPGHKTGQKQGNLGKNNQDNGAND
jgi:hypothetical protein